jgi:CubicO group peptidase (beta-lactamase class C family)
MNAKPASTTALQPSPIRRAKVRGRKLRRPGTVAAVAAVSLLGLPVAPAGAADLPSQGRGWDALESQVDALVKAAFDADDLPGMTVAVTKDDRLVLSKGYGYANVATKTPMTDWTRSLLGSTTKAVVTGPTAWRALMANPDVSASSRPYDTGGALRGEFESSYVTGIGRFTPIVGIAITPDSKTYTWYADGTVSKGSTPDLDQYAAAQPYKLPAGKRPVDVREMAITSSGSVITWYDDGSRSLGTPTNLGAHDSTLPLTENGTDRTQAAAGYGMDDIVAIDMDQESGKVYTWYDDGTRSVGKRHDLDYYAKPEAVSYPEFRTPLQVRGAAIAPNSRVYTWLSKDSFGGKAVSGTSLDLDAYIKAYDYTTAPTSAPNWHQWYRSITYQHLLDHTSGFAGGGDTAGAAKMFGKSEDEVTYAEIHHHFLRTRKLQSAPGEDYRYSNHGMGLWTILVPRLTGSSFSDYARNAHLAAFGLQDRIVPQQASHPASTDAANHQFKNGAATPVAFEASGTGAAAGGYRAAARDLASLMVSLDWNFSDADIDRMGWMSTSKGKLSHGGDHGDGGTSFVVMFPEGYVSSTGVALSDVKIAIAVNAAGDPHPNDDGKDFSSGTLSALADQIALRAGQTTIPATYDIWKG